VVVVGVTVVLEVAVRAAIELPQGHLAAVRPLARGRAVQIAGESWTPRETDPVEAVNDEWVWRTCAVLPPTLQAMVWVQRLTGCRPQDVCNMTLAALDCRGEIWLYEPAQHKRAHAGGRRVVYIGPRAQEVLLAWLRPELDEPIWSPRQAMAERHGVASTHRHQAPRRPETGRRVGDHWTSRSYAAAISRAAQEAGVPHWTPNQLRHAAATRLRRDHGLDVAQVILGHARADVTQVYAQADLARAAVVMEAVG
jgi:integrase